MIEHGKEGPTPTPSRKLRKSQAFEGFDCGPSLKLASPFSVAGPPEIEVKRRILGHPGWGYRTSFLAPFLLAMLWSLPRLDKGKEEGKQSPITNRRFGRSAPARQGNHSFNPVFWPPLSCRSRWPRRSVSAAKAFWRKLACSGTRL